MRHRPSVRSFIRSFVHSGLGLVLSRLFPFHFLSLHFITPYICSFPSFGGCLGVPIAFVDRVDVGTPYLDGGYGKVR